MLHIRYVQVVTLEGWVDVSTVVADSGAGWFAAIFFVSLLCVTSFYVFNLFLAVLRYAYQASTLSHKPTGVHTPAHVLARRGGCGWMCGYLHPSL